MAGLVPAISRWRTLPWLVASLSTAGASGKQRIPGSSPGMTGVEMVGGNGTAHRPEPLA
jgi:hypothetical protein